MDSTKNKLIYILLIVAGMVIIPFIAYFNMLKHLDDISSMHFIIPTVVGAFVGFAFANIFALYKLNKMLQFSKDEFKYMVDNISGKFAIYRYRGHDNIVTYVSKGSHFLVGLAPEDIVGKRWDEIVNFDEKMMQKAQRNQMQIIKSSGIISENEYHFTDHNGDEHFWLVHEYATVHGNEVVINGIIEDITQLKLNILRNHLYSNIFSHLKQALIITDPAGYILEVNSIFTKMTGYEADEIIGKKTSMIKSGKQNRLFYADMWNNLLLNKEWHGEVWNKHKDGSLFCCSLSISAILDEHGHTTHYAGIFNDITEKREYLDDLETHVHHDPLTSLPNRKIMMEKINRMINRRDSLNTINTVAFIDLDGFKTVNDTYGHEAGDAILVEISHRLYRLIRKHDTLARFGGDEFLLLLEHISDEDEITPIIKRVVDEIEKPVLFNDTTLQVSASIGLSIYKGEEDINGEELVRRADKAMYLVKMNGKGGFRYYP